MANNMSNLAKVYIVILNWNGWQDTIECLESVFRNDYPNYHVIVCDNDSQNESLERIKDWAEGRLDVLMAPDNPLRPLSHPPVAKPIPYLEINRSAAEAGGAEGDRAAPLVLIRTGANLGFAGGNNVGLRYILAKGDADYVWLLNNDTVIRPDTLSHLVNKAESDPQIGSLGSTILYYDRPQVINAAGGGMMMKYFASSYHVMLGRSLLDIKQGNDLLPLSLDYITGASCFLPLRILRIVGLLDESFFHSWEDADLGLRIIKAGYKNRYAPRSLVYHKLGESIGGKSPIADYYDMRSSLIFYRKHSGSAFLAISLLRLMAKIINRIRRKQIDRLPILLKACCHGVMKVNNASK